MTFREWYNTVYAPTYEGHGMDDPEIAEMAFEAGFNNGYDAGQADGYQEGTRNGAGLDDGRV
jgi:hypothetical protein